MEVCIIRGGGGGNDLVPVRRLPFGRLPISRQLYGCGHAHFLCNSRSAARTCHQAREGGAVVRAGWCSAACIHHQAKRVSC